jgi:hypothetical protein
MLSSIPSGGSLFHYIPDSTIGLSVKPEEGLVEIAGSSGLVFSLDELFATL